MPTRLNKNHIADDIRAATSPDALLAVYNDNAFMINHDKTLNRAYTGKMIDLKCAAGKKAITRTPDDLRALVDDEQPYDIF